MTATLRKPGSSGRSVSGSTWGNQQFGGITAQRSRSCLSCGLFKDPLGGKGTGVRWMCAGCIEKKEASNG